MSKRRKKLLAAAGWFLGCVVFSLMTFDHATCDLSEFEGPAFGRWARLKKGLYKVTGRRGVVALDIGFLALCLCFFAASLKGALAKEAPPVLLADDVLARARTSAEQGTCACCQASARGTPTAFPEGAASLNGAVGYLCKTCGALICSDCAENRIGQSRWDGWARKACPVCGGRFDPETAMVGP